MKKLLITKGIMGVLASGALMVTSMNVNSTCIFVMHQPKVPELANQLNKTND
ncbi:MAG: cyclic lactone autoinducer peptide [Bacillota bacterium]|nr:cyclic lactone autoinducer peptide [Bacillota bacterium]